MKNSKSATLRMDWRLQSAKLAAAFCVLLVSACASQRISKNFPPPHAPVAYGRLVEERSLSFQPGDGLELYVAEDGSFNKTYVVRAEGYILVPRVGRIQVAGLDMKAAEKRIHDAFLQLNVMRNATVMVEHDSSALRRAALKGDLPGVGHIKVFLVGGAVRRPGQRSVPYLRGQFPGLYQTLLDGGLGRFANIQAVEVRRLDAQGLRQRAVVDLRRVRDGRAMDFPIGDGDIITVPERFFGF